MNQQQQQPQGTQPNNKKNQKAAFAGYSAEENKYKTTVESPSDPTERREKTALDEILSALIFKGEQISEASVKRLRQLELPPKELKSSVQSADTALMSTMGFCMNLFLEFAFTAQVSVNGAQFRTRLEASKHIVHLEALALVKSFEFVAHDLAAVNSRQLFLVDSMSAALAFDRCRSKNFRMLRSIRRFCAFSLAHNIAFFSALGSL